MSSPMRRGPLVAVLAVSTPLSLGVETLIRKALFNQDMNDLRDFIGPFLTPVAWTLLGVTGLGVLLGIPAHDALQRRAVAKLGERVNDPVARASAETMTLYIASSIVQLPTLASTVTFTLGAELLPVFAALWVAALGVVLMGVFGARPKASSAP